MVREAVAGNRIRMHTALPREIVDIATKWATYYGLPLTWVLATIKVESRGKTMEVGDGGVSIGLMQINTSPAAHADLLKAWGLTREDLFNPDTNVKVGTYLLRQAYDNVVKALNGRTAPTDLGTLTRLAYWGPAATLGRLRKGENPVTWAKESGGLPARIVSSWRTAMAETSRVV